MPSLLVLALRSASLVVVGYVLLRFVGRYVGIAAAAIPAGRSDTEHLVWLPTALMPQAGVALGLALSASHRFPELASTLLSTTIASTLVFEIVGPLLTKLALTRVASR